MRSELNRSNCYPVIIVGAGPVGICAALRLSALGIGCALLESLDTPGGDLRASTFHPPTLEMLDTLGLAVPLIERGLKTHHWQIRMHETGEKALFDLSVLADDTPYPFRLQCEQSTLCQLGLERVKADPAIDLHMSTSVTSVEQDEDCVTVTAADGRTFRADYVIGADGARSIVRDAIGLGFEGFTYDETTILATTRFPFHEHVADLSNVNYCWSSHGTFSLLRLPTLWRCSLYADQEETTEAALTPDAIERKLQRIVPKAERYQVDEIRPYRVHQRIVTDYRVGRVALAGDAAHLNSPSGGMGMNGGIHDAFALADALKAILGGSALTLLDRYTRQRKTIAQEQILDQAHRNRTRMQERDMVKRRAELERLKKIADDKILARGHLLKSSMIAGLRQAALIQ